MGKLNRKLSTISTLHFVKLILRLILFVAVLIVYLFRKSSDLSNPPYLLFFVWMLFIIEMIFRFFPSRFESMGCQKQFKKNYLPKAKHTAPQNQSW